MTIKTLIQLFKVFTNQHPILQTFSWGNLSDYSREDYITKYPAIHFVPQPSTLGNTSQDITFSVLVYDLLNEYVDNPTNSNQLDSMALCEEILGDFVNNFINQLTQYGYFLNMPVSYVYFTDRFAESVCGVEAQITITIEQTACIPPYIEPTPTPTTTPTPTPTCPITQQYLEVELSESTKFKLVLWNDSGFSSPTTALCDYVVSGTAYGSLGTIYTGTETITEGQHQHQFNLSGVLLPGEVVSSFVVYSINTSTCVCPVNIDFSPYIPVSPTPTPTPTSSPTPTPTITPTNSPLPPSPTPTACYTFSVNNSSLSGTLYYTYVNCNGNTISFVELGPQETQYICSRITPYYESGVNSLTTTNLGACVSPTSCKTYQITQTTLTSTTISYTDCDGNPVSYTLSDGEVYTDCFSSYPIRTAGGSFSITTLGDCV